MTDKDRNQINVQLGPGQMEQLRTLAGHYGTVTTVVRVAIDALWREHVRGQSSGFVNLQAGNEDEQPGGAAVGGGAVADTDG